MGKRSAFVAVIMAFALVVAACGDDDGSSLIDQSDGTAAPSGNINPTGIPTDVGNLPGVSGECEALLNLFLSIGGVFLGGEVRPLDAGTLAGLPSEIRADALYVSQTLSDFSVSMQQMGVDFSDPSTFATLTPAQQEALGDLSDSLDTAEFNAATDNLSAYGEAQCESQFDIGE
jgi:hypothetical protein